MDFFLYLCLFSTYVMENQGWAYFGAPAVIHLRHPAPEGGMWARCYTPYSFLCTRLHQCTFSFVEVCLGHNYMENKVWTL